MQLNDATARTLIAKWSDAPAPAWTDAQRDSLAQRLIELSKCVTPHIVLDVALTEEQAQHYLLARVVSRLDDWLTSVAADLRSRHGRSGVRYRADGSQLAVGLRSATIEELRALPAIGDELAEDIATFVARHPATEDMAALLEVDGVGTRRLARIREAGYLDRPVARLSSPSLLAFMQSPGVREFIAVLTTSDLQFFFGDTTTLLRRGGGREATAVDRFLDFVDAITDHSRRAASSVDGVLASEVLSYLERHRRRHDLLAAAQETSGALLVNRAYMATAKQLIDSAQTSVDLMVFLGTASATRAEDVGTLELVQAMEAAAARGVAVRVVLDQDDGGEPYRSLPINRPLLERFKANGVRVKFDEKDTLLHSKVLIVDQQKAIVGSHNWTRSGLNDTHEVSAYLTSTPVAKQYHDRFTELWNRLPAVV